ncbi:MAG: hypothetical protein GC134_08140 [Proteobacteria bacterium]|nr:hypothetical protein [Pseudomonadota bacterium]
MKQWLKNLAIAGATAGAVVLGAASASAVSFTVVIEKIELMKNGSDSDRFVIYNPSAGIAASATSTLDLLNANKTGATLGVAAPKSGTYKTMLVTFSKISVAAETATISATQDLTGALTGGEGFGSELGRKVLVMGEVDNNAGKIGALLGGGITAVPMQPIVSDGSTVSLPSFNFFLPAANVVTTGTGTVNVLKNPVPISVARTDVDSAATPNVTIGVKARAFRGVSTTLGGTTGSTFTAKLGLFKSALDLKPVYVKSVTMVSSTAVGAGSVTEATFLDVADGTYLPLAWLDKDSDGLLDSGEAFIAVDGDDTGLVTTTNNLAAGADHQHFLTVNKSDIFGANATTTGTISTTSAAFNTSATTTNGSTTNVNTGAPLGTTFGNNSDGYLGQSSSFYLFPAREISVTIAFTEDGSTTLDNGTDACAAATRCGLGITWQGGTVASNAHAATVTFTVGSVTAPSFTLELDNGGGDGNLDNAETASLVVVDTAGKISEISGNALLTYAQTDANTSTLKISPVPLATLIDMNRNVNTGFGTFSVVTAIQARNTGTGNALGAIDAGSITQAAATLDADAGGNYSGTTENVSIVNGNKVSLSANLGN